MRHYSVQNNGKGSVTNKFDDSAEGAMAEVRIRARTVPGQAAPRGAYPHLKIVGGLLYVCGVSARRPDNSIAGAQIDGLGTATLDIRVQTRAVIENIRAVLNEAQADLTDLVQVTAYLVSMNDFAGYNEVYSEYFGPDGPVRTTVAVHQLPHPHLLIEMQVIAFRPGAGSQEGHT